MVLRPHLRGGVFMAIWPGEVRKGSQGVSFWNYRAGPEMFLSSETSLPLGKMGVLVVSWDGTHSRGGLQSI